MYTVLSVVKKNGLAWSLLAVSLSAQVVPPRLPRKTPPSTAAIQGIVRNLAGLGLGGVSVTIRETSREQAFNTITSGDGVYRLLDVPPGAYQLKVDSPGFEPFERADIRLEAGEVFDLDITLKDLPGGPEGPRRVVHGNQGRAVLRNRADDVYPDGCARHRFAHEIAVRLIAGWETASCWSSASTPP